MIERTQPTYDHTEASRRETMLVISGDKPMSHYAGRPYLFVTFDGDTLEGVTAIDDKDRIIVRFSDGRWAYANTRWAE
jgi:hypothetical protein